MFPIKLFWGMLFCQSMTGSILVLGWTYRSAQRSAFRFWHLRARSDQPTDRQDHWPNWFVQQNFGEILRASAGTGLARRGLRIVPALGQSLWLNFWIGLRAIANTWVLTLPACLFWWFGWYDGWNNSFNKGYEQAVVGPAISLLGIAWLITMMFYLPLAQARQAVTGQWRAFYQFRLIWKLVRDRWIYCVFLALLYSFSSIPLSALKTSPMFWMRNNPALGALTATQVIAAL